MLTDVKRVHLIGIGGIGVSAVARVLIARGYHVSGSDVRESQITEALRAEGAVITIGHDAALVEDTDLVVYSTAIPETNPELVAARRITEGGGALKLRHRAEVLGALLDPWESVGVIGTHGKGTVSAMTTACLEAADRNPSFIIGGLLNDYGLNARVTGPDGWVVVEIDESDGSLVHVRPRRLVVNNVEADHLNYYDDLEAVYQTIGGVLQDERERAMAILHVGDPGVREVVRRLERPIRALRCGFDSDLDGAEAEVVGSELEVGPSGSRFQVTFRGKPLGELTMPQPGRYNAMNALVAATAALSAEVPFEAIQSGLGRYGGIENRFTVVDAGPVRVVKDYISHPTGMRRVLAAARTLHDGPITAIFKPYRFTMIHYLGDEYARAFDDADHVVVTELYTAGEVPIPGVDAPWLVDKIRAAGTDTAFVEDMDAIPAYLLDRMEPGQQLLFFGGDDLFRLADRFVELLDERGEI